MPFSTFRATHSGAIAILGGASPRAKIGSASILAVAHALYCTYNASKSQETFSMVDRTQLSQDS
jgi:hypothetical protein